MEALYLRCLTNRLTDKGLIEQLAADYSRHQEQEMYGTSSQEIAAKVAKEAARQAHEEDSAIFQETTARLTGKLNETTSELECLKALLKLHHIAYK